VRTGLRVRARRGGRRGALSAVWAPVARESGRGGVSGKRRVTSEGRLGEARRARGRRSSPRAKLPLTRRPSPTLSMAPFIPSGVIHCPFLMFTGRPVAPAATRRSVWRQRKAGIWSASATAAAVAHCDGRWTSVSTARPVRSRTRASASRPSSRPGPRCAVALERFALSKLALNTTPPGRRSASRASRSPTRKLSASSSTTHGPAMRKSRSQGKNTRPFGTRALSPSARTRSAPASRPARPGRPRPAGALHSRRPQ